MCQPCVSVCLCDVSHVCVCDVSAMCVCVSVGSVGRRAARSLLFLPLPLLLRLHGDRSLGLAPAPRPAPPRSIWNPVLRIPSSASARVPRQLRTPTRTSWRSMVKLGCSFSGKPGKDPGDQGGAAMDSVPLISPLDVSQLQPPFADQLPTARMIAFAMALMGCVLIMYKAVWYDQFTCPDGFLLRHKICTPLTLEMYYTEMDPERHRSILAAIGAYPLSRKHAAEMPWAESYRSGKEERKGSALVGVPGAPGALGPVKAAVVARTEPPGKPSAEAEEEAPRAVSSVPAPATQ
ncbi:neuron-specific vesicular protein calcyon isoform X2 [Dipodomys merriami]|uniref:neuron-specific vesicular protein calcyon isoform X2 n=1 Tax=Dipodomys merriami TaxID=94247 RepID=UPI0038558A58